MNTTDQIESLFKQGVVSLTIALSPKKDIYVQAGQIVPTGSGATHMQVTHQIDEGSLPEMLNSLAKQVEQTHNMRSTILTVHRKA